MLGSFYEKDATKRAKSRYNYRHGFKTKMHQYKTTINEDMAVQFYPTCRNSPPVVRFATTPELARRVETKAVSSQTEVVGKIVETSTPTSTPIQSSSLSTPSKKRKQPNDANVCRICSISYGSRMDDEYGSIWIKCSARSCCYWAHLFCLGFSCKDEDQSKLDKLVNYYCKVHNPYKIPRRRSIAEKL